MSQIMHVEVNPADVAGVRIRYRLGNADFNIALSALYQLLLLNPQRGCSIMSTLREWEQSSHLTDRWVANTPCWASLGELGWDGCGDEEILQSSCGWSPPTTRTASPATPPPPPAHEPKPPTMPPPKPTKHEKPPTHKRKSFELSCSSSSDEALPRGHGKEVGGGEAGAAAKAA